MTREFTWNHGARASVSFSFDDARLSQIDYGLAILAAYDAKATFYVSPGTLEDRTEGWEIAIDRGHEIGNHTYTHPCSGNFDFAKDRALEDYTLERMSAELEKADEAIEAALGVKPTTFAYPCGQTFIGRGEATRSYVPLVASRFLAGRGFMAECANDPRSCDLSRLNASACDDLTAAPLIKLIESAVASGSWLIFAGHEIGNPKTGQNTMAGTLRTLLAYIRQNNDTIWLGTVAEVASYIDDTRRDETRHDDTEE
jgi:peptidoglycan-N-acetylglucosamine deacetylase